MRPAYGKGTVMIAELLLGLLVYLIPAALFGPASLAAWLAPIVFCVAVETGASEILAFMVSMIIVSAAYMLAVYLPWALEVERFIVSIVTVTATRATRTGLAIVRAVPLRYPDETPSVFATGPYTLNSTKMVRPCLCISRRSIRAPR